MNRRPPSRGYTAAELLLALALIGVISAIAVPSFSEVRVRRLETAASEVVTALHFARQQSVRTGVPHGVRKLDALDAISVFRLDTRVDPPLEVHDVNHPIERAGPYLIDLGAHPRTRATSIVAYFQYFDLATAQEAVAFDGRGEPVDGASGKPLQKRVGGGFVLTNGDRSLVVSVARLSGRVQPGEVGAVIADPAVVF